MEAAISPYLCFQSTWSTLMDPSVGLLAHTRTVIIMECRFALLQSQTLPYPSSLSHRSALTRR